MQGNILKNYRSSFILLGAITAGALTGVFFPDFARLLKPLGDIFLNLLFTSIVPLIFFAVASAVIQVDQKEKTGKILALSITVFVITSLLAAAYTIGVLKMFPLSPIPDGMVQGGETSGEEAGNIADQIVNAFTVNDFSSGLLSKGNMLALIVFSLLIGISIKISGEQGKGFGRFILSGNEVMKKLLALIMKAAPLGLGAYFAYLVADIGSQMLKTYAEAILLYYIAALVYFILAFSLYAFTAKGTRGIKEYWRNNITPSLTALGTCSSLATIPANMEAGEKMGIRTSVNKLGMPLGASLHKEGSSIGAVIKFAVLFAIINRSFSGIDIMILVLAIALIYSIVEGGIPNGGYVGAFFMISALGLDLKTFLPVVVLISTVIDPMATLLNATGDTASGMMISRFQNPSRSAPPGRDEGDRVQQETKNPPAGRQGEQQKTILGEDV